MDNLHGAMRRAHGAGGLDAMPSDSLARLDANLIVALDVLLEERNVSRAARRLRVSQPAASHMLRRLRELLGDPLLIRSGGKMVPTTRALALAGPVRAGLTQLERALSSPEDFDPSRDEATLRVAVLDIFATTLVPRLVKEIAQSGPRLRLEVTALDMARSWEQLRAGIMDAAIIGPWDIPSDMLGEPLFDEHLRCLVRADHPILDPAVPVTAARYCAFPQAVFRITGDGGHPIDAALAAQGLSRRVVARLPFFQSAGEVAATTDVIVNLPASLARTLTARDPGLVSFLPPLPAPICYRVSLVWPRALDQAAPQRWLRSRLCASAAALVDAVGAASGQLQRVVPH